MADIQDKQIFSPLQQRDTAKRYLCVHIFSFPFWGLLYLLPMILYKDLQASPFQVATIIALKPMVSLFSPYWSQWVHEHPHRLLPNLYWANILKFFPFLFAPFINNSWYFIFSFGVFMMLSRGTIPAWMQILKMNLPKQSRDKVCATGSVIDFFGAALLPIAFGGILDNFHESWRWLLFATAILGNISTFFILALPKKFHHKVKKTLTPKKSFSSHFFAPWRNCREILSKRPDFLRFQLGFFLGGTGLMIIQPILPKYFVNNLHLSYTGILTAIAACKGIGFILSSPLWVRSFRQARIFAICSVVTLFAALFPMLLAFAQINHLLVYFAYLIYGIMQGGSELSWKMSGVIFSDNSDSSPYSSINILTVGIRGLLIPYVGSLLFFITESYLFMMFLGTFFSISATFLMASYVKNRKYLQP